CSEEEVADECGGCSSRKNPQESRIIFLYVPPTHLLSISLLYHSTPRVTVKTLQDERSINNTATSTGPWRLTGAGLSPGTAVISLSHDRECSEAVGKRGCSPGESRAPRRALVPSSHLALLRQNDE
ncbi:hypothetical protein KUCAC02_008364, partial [Chaenocephalus aceratus]